MPASVTGSLLPSLILIRSRRVRVRGQRSRGPGGPPRLVPTVQDDLQNSRHGHRDDDAQQAKERPTNQNRDHYYDGMQPRLSAHDAWAQIHPFEQLLANKQQDNTQDATHTGGITQEEEHQRWHQTSNNTHIGHEIG